MSRYVLIHGLVLYSLPCLIVTTVLGRFIDGRWPRTALQVVTMALAWIFGGLAIGSISHRRQLRLAEAARRAEQPRLAPK